MSDKPESKMSVILSIGTALIFLCIFLMPQQEDVVARGQAKQQEISAEQAEAIPAVAEAPIEAPIEPVAEVTPPLTPTLKIHDVKFFDLGDGVGTLEFSVESNLPTTDNLEVMVYKNTLVSGGLKTCRYSYLSGQSRSVEYFKSPQSFDLVDKNPLTTCMTIDNGTLNSNAKDAGADWATEDNGGNSDGPWVDYDTKATKALHPLLKINVRHTGSNTKALELFPLKKAKKYY